MCRHATVARCALVLKVPLEPEEIQQIFLDLYLHYDLQAQSCISIILCFPLTGAKGAPVQRPCARRGWRGKFARSRRCCASSVQRLTAAFPSAAAGELAQALIVGVE